MPTECVLSFRHEWGISGLWAGYGASALLLTSLYFCILACIDWKATAQWAANSDEFSVSSSSSVEDEISTKEESDGPCDSSFSGPQLDCTLIDDVDYHTVDTE
mgnify:CR=1 FL=1